jgi:hypothetical protein
MYMRFVARLERSDSRDRCIGGESVPAFAALKPGYTPTMER